MHYDFQKKHFELDTDYDKNFIAIDGEDFYLEPLDTTYRRPKGGNSYLFRLVSAGDPNISLVIKFCKWPIESQGRDEKRVQRFLREIRALEKCKASGLDDSIIRIEHKGAFPIATDLNLGFYVMEAADSDLRKYLEDEELSLPQKLVLCKGILDSLQRLHEIGIYHRDIKPDNILNVGPNWKLADLGLINFREEDLGVDVEKDRIGPFGYYSPEAVNFRLNLRKSEDNGFFCRIDEKSDIFQLGLVFWFIFQQQIPSGQVVFGDLSCAPNERLFEKLLLRMLQYCKRRRASMNELQEQLLPLMSEWGLT